MKKLLFVAALATSLSLVCVGEKTVNDEKAQKANQALEFAIYDAYRIIEHGDFRRTREALEIATPKTKRKFEKDEFGQQILKAMDKKRKEKEKLAEQKQILAEKNAVNFKALADSTNDPKRTKDYRKQVKKWEQIAKQLNKK